MNETTVVKMARVHASELGAVLFRNNVGRLPEPGGGRWVEFGLCKGASDTIGYQPLLITQEMVGTKIARFVAVELKDYDGMDEAQIRDFIVRRLPTGSKAAKHLSEQCNFIDAVRRNHGLAGFARNNQELETLLRG